MDDSMFDRKAPEIVSNLHTSLSISFYMAVMAFGFAVCFASIIFLVPLDEATRWWLLSASETMLFLTWFSRKRWYLSSENERICPGVNQWLWENYPDVKRSPHWEELWANYQSCLEANRTLSPGPVRNEVVQRKWKMVVQEWKRMRADVATRQAYREVPSLFDVL